MSLQAINTVPSRVPTISPDNSTRYYRNGLRVSDVAYPTYFPQSSTKRVGDDKIVGLGRFTMPLSQDNFGYFSLVVFCTDGIFVMGVDRTGATVYLDCTYAHPEVCTNRDTICEIGGGLYFSTDKGLCLLTKDDVTLVSAHLDGRINFLPNNDSTYPKDGNHIYQKLLDSSNVVSPCNPFGVGKFEDSISRSNFVDFINESGTVVRYISKKNKLLIFNKEYQYCYFMDIPTGFTTKLGTNVWFGDGNYPVETFWTGLKNTSTGKYQYKKLIYGFYSSTVDDLSCMIVSRPIVIAQDDKFSYRLVVTGHFEGKENASDWAEIVAMESWNCENWQIIGFKEKKLSGGFNDFGCITDRVSWKYVQFIFAAKLSDKSHIDSIDITVDKRYNNKKR